MVSRPVVLCYSSFTSPVPAFDLLFELAPAYEGDFTLLGEVVVTDLSEDERAKIEGILVSTGAINRTHRKVGKEIINLLPNLKVISTPSTGINHIDVQAATDRGICVGRSPGHFLSDAVAEFAFGLLLASSRSIVLANEIARTTVFSSGQVSKQQLQLKPVVSVISCCFKVEKLPQKSGKYITSGVIKYFSSYQSFGGKIGHR